ncbi:MAG: hypothetical protein KKE17_01420 [Proteobacteria bacterium]|nr:hypothetical protein [Pseudomonadota bacterium]
MKKAYQGLFWSGLVFPGAGQLRLGRLLSGAAYITGALLGVGGIMYSALQRIPYILEQLGPDLGQGTIDIEKIVKLSAQSSRIGNSPLERLSLALIVGCWAVSLVHAYFIGKRLDLETARLEGNETPKA